jgi:molecular chaperone GrpE
MTFSISTQGKPNPREGNIIWKLRFYKTFCPIPAVGSILDDATFANNFIEMKHKDNKNQFQNQEADFDSVNINTDENIDGNQHLNEPVAEEGELERLKEQLNEHNDRYLRLVAEFENFKRRNARERMELIQTAGREIITELLDVLDDSERAQKQMETTDNVQQIKEGVLLVFNKLRNTLTVKGLKPMETLNKEFNPDLEEAITEIDAGEDMKGKVVAEVQKGYYLNDKIIRFAKVVVGK